LASFEQREIVRKRRAIIYDDDFDVANMLKEHFTLRGYEALTYQEPVNCPAYEEYAACKELYPCADIILVDFNMPKMNGIEMLRAQSLHGCKVPAKSRALMSGGLDEAAQEGVEELGCMYFQKPFSFDEVAKWLDAREKLMDLSRRLGMRRKGKRVESNKEIECLVSGTGEPVKGIVMNAGPSGLCLKLACNVREGQTIALLFGHSSVSRTASVRWVRSVEYGTCIAGVQYM
jgi:CheY-like chemotaxis protein